jgi:hypothetical protein
MLIMDFIPFHPVLYLNSGKKNSPAGGHAGPTCPAIEHGDNREYNTEAAHLQTEAFLRF